MDIDEKQKNAQYECVELDDKEVQIENKTEEADLLYKVSDYPPFYLTVLFAFQQALIALTPTIAVTFIVADVACVGDNKEIRTKLLSSSLFMNGITTVLMNTVGIRLPLFQGAAGVYIIPLLALEAADPERCTRKNVADTGMGNGTIFINDTQNNGTEEAMDIMMKQIRDMQGSLILAGAIHSLIGVTGIVGILMTFIGPITVVPAMMLVGIFVVRVVVKYSKTHWGISFATAIMAIILSMYLSKRKVPIPTWSRKNGFKIIWYPLHQVLSLLLSVIFGWILSTILTHFDLISPDPNSPEYMARTDSRSDAITTAHWFYLPYPGQFGLPSFNIGVFCAFLIGSIMSVLDSIGDYHACAATCKVPPPPGHAINRGIAIEGLCSAISGTVGCGHATSTYGNNIGAIGVTKVGSRVVFIGVGIIYLLFGIVGKFAAVFISIPYPVLGGTLIAMMGMFMGVVISNLEVVSLTSTRNLGIIGIALIVGLAIPQWIEKEPHGISTGDSNVDTILRILLANPNLTGGLVACFLDNTIPGTKEERGIDAWQNIGVSEEKQSRYSEGLDVYEPLLPKRLLAFRFMKYIPFLPYRRTYQIQQT